MRRPAYDSPSIPITWERINYAGNTNEAVEVIPEFKEKILELYRQHPEESKKRWGENPFEVQNIMKYWVCSKDPRFHFIPTDTVYIRIDKDAVVRSGMIIPEEYKEAMPEYMKISLGGRGRLFRGQDLMLLEMIAQTNWERPLYMSMTVGRSNYLSTISDFFVQEGLAYRITPFNWRELGYSGDYDNFVADTKKFYHNVMERFRFGKIKDNPDYYIDEAINRMALTHRRLFSSLATQLLMEGEEEMALNVLNRTEEELPSSLIPHEYFSGLEMVRAYMHLGETEKASNIISLLADECIEYLAWYNSLNKRQYANAMNDIYMRTRMLQEIIKTLGSRVRDSCGKIHERVWSAVRTYAQ